MRYLGVVYVESRRCRDLAGLNGSILVKFTSGSKARAARRGEIPDDDYDFAFRFLETCFINRAIKCVAVVRDENIAMYIADLLRSDKYSRIADRVEVYITRSFLERAEAVCGKLRHILEYVNRYIDTVKG